MALDLAKYRALFLEEATEHLAEISTSLLALEKDLAAAGPIDAAFRMAHSIKSMAASLEYDSITELAHALEDRMERARAAGRVANSTELEPLFEGLEGLESMVETVRLTGEAPAPETALVERVRGVPGEPVPSESAERLKKKLLS